MVTLPSASWLFFKARAKRPYLVHTGRASNAEKQPTGHGPEGCDENGPAAALLVGYISIQIYALLAPCRRPILIATKAMLFMGQDTRTAGRPRPFSASLYLTSRLALGIGSMLNAESTNCSKSVLNFLREAFSRYTMCPQS